MVVESLPWGPESVENNSTDFAQLKPLRIHFSGKEELPARNPTAGSSCRAYLYSRLCRHTPSMMQRCCITKRKAAKQRENDFLITMILKNEKQVDCINPKRQNLIRVQSLHGFRNFQKLHKPAVQCQDTSYVKMTYTKSSIISCLLHGLYPPYVIADYIAYHPSNSLISSTAARQPGRLPKNRPCKHQYS